MRAIRNGGIIKTVYARIIKTGINIPSIAYKVTDKKRGVNLNTSELSRIIVEALEDKKGEDIVLLDIDEIADFASHFIICSGTSVRMLDALADHIKDTVKPLVHYQPRVEGKPEDGWLVLDIGEIIVHLFTPDQRDYFKLEELWSEGKILLHVQ